MKVKDYLVIMATAELRCSIEQLFVDGFRYAERYLTLREFQFHLKRYFESNKTPSDIVDYCLDVLAKRAIPLKRTRLLKGH